MIRRGALLWLMMAATGLWAAPAEPALDDAGHVLAANLPAVIATGVLFLTPITFLLSIGRNSRELADWAALGLGLLFAPVAALAHTGIDLVISGVAAGTIAYGLHRWRRGR